jgi:hypothetical protein
MIDLIGAAIEISNWLTQHRVPHFFIGGLAVQRWGDPRLTSDVDLCAIIDPSETDDLVQRLLKDFNAKPGAAEVARRVQLVPLRSSTGVTIEVALGFSGFEKTALERATRKKVAPGKSIPVCSAEDLVVYKIIANRPRDIEDVKMVILRQQDRLDERYIRRTLKDMEELVEDTDCVRRFDAAWKNHGPKGAN